MSGRSDPELLRLLAEDIPYGDLTTELLAIGGRAARMEFRARTSLIACCLDEAVRLIELCGGNAEALCVTGEPLAAGAPMLAAHGPAASLLAAWKVAQTLLEACSGIAGAVRRMAAAAAVGGGAVIACSRKNFPGSRAFAVKAVLAGGGVPHRLGLSESILLFPEHRRFLGSDVAAAVERMRRACPERKIVAEVVTGDEAMSLARAGVDVLQLEKFPVAAVAALSARIAALAAPPLLAAAGGVDEGNAAAYAGAGADILVTSAPYWAKPAEIQVDIVPA